MNRRTPMQVSVENILKAHGCLEEFRTASEFHLAVTNEPYMRLVIERHGDTVSVAHTYQQNGDAMRDPEIVFALPYWAPIEITQDPVGVYRSKFFTHKGKRMIRLNFDREVAPLVRVWAANLKLQDYEHGHSVSYTHQAQPETH